MESQKKILNDKLLESQGIKGDYPRKHVWDYKFKIFNVFIFFFYLSVMIKFQLKSSQPNPKRKYFLINNFRGGLKKFEKW